jgi:serine/threonine protein kinase
MRKLGKYEILEELGRGGFAVVYKARDTELERLVALKVLHPQLTVDPKFIERFKREARTTAGMNHPHIATVYDVGEAEGQLYIAMELACGPSLAEHIQDQGTLPREEALKILEQAASALDYAHERGFVHRDVKPSNILLDPNKGALLTDFGLSRMIESSGCSLTVSGGVMGTPAYIAPEIWAGERPTPASDVYALGCVLYEMVTGEVLFGTDSPLTVMRRHDEGPQLNMNKVGEGMGPVLLKALEKSPDERYQRAGEFAVALRGESGRPKAIQRGKQPSQTRRVSGWAWALGTLAVLLLGANLLWRVIQRPWEPVPAVSTTPTVTATPSQTPTHVASPPATLVRTSLPIPTTGTPPMWTPAPTEEPDPPDLVITDLEVDTSDPCQGIPLHIVATLRNRGGRTVENLHWAWRVCVQDDCEYTEAPGAFTLEPDEQVTAQMEYLFSGWASYTTEAWVDSREEIEESDEDNNTRELVIPVKAGLPDLVISTISFDPDPPTQGENMTVEVSIRNRGSKPSGAFIAEWWSHVNAPAPACEWNLSGGVAEDGTVTLDCTYAYPSWYGNITTRAIADADDDVAEWDEKNNSLDKDTPVRQP